MRSTLDERGASVNVREKKVWETIDWNATHDIMDIG